MESSETPFLCFAGQQEFIFTSPEYSAYTGSESQDLNAGDNRQLHERGDLVDAVEAISSHRGIHPSCRFRIWNF